MPARPARTRCASFWRCPYCMGACYKPYLRLTNFCAFSRFRRMALPVFTLRRGSSVPRNSDIMTHTINQPISSASIIATTVLLFNFYSRLRRCQYSPSRLHYPVTELCTAAVVESDHTSQRKKPMHILVGLRKGLSGVNSFCRAVLPDAASRERTWSGTARVVGTPRKTLQARGDERRKGEDRRKGKESRAKQRRFRKRKPRRRTEYQTTPPHAPSGKRHGNES
jgi:hypothetical protein